MATNPFAVDPYADYSNGALGAPLPITGQGDPSLGGSSMGNLGGSIGSLAGPAGSIAGNIAGSILGSVLPNPALNLQKQQTQFQQQQYIQQQQQKNTARGAVLPGEYTTLGYTPDQANQLAQEYTSVPIPGSNVSVGKAHNTANQWTQGSQNAFDSAMAGLDNQVQNGTMSASQAAAQKNTLAQNYLKSLSQFSLQGANNSKVAGQAYNTFLKWYGDPSKYGLTNYSLGASASSPVAGANVG